MNKYQAPMNQCPKVIGYLGTIIYVIFTIVLSYMLYLIVIRELLNEKKEFPTPVYLIIGFLSWTMINICLGLVTLCNNYYWWSIIKLYFWALLIIHIILSIVGLYVGSTYLDYFLALDVPDEYKSSNIAVIRLLINAIYLELGLFLFATFPLLCLFPCCCMELDTYDDDLEERLLFKEK